ncbi:hypothetical protein IV203_037537 [Nitzschia inconspicua]|uniref:Uncharacterized protein n=1 Tax=Nitzschia inconspicua TaxID=303405 RepID=A0A9K3LM34_9STRA|nr:hypothetical protein IV203_037537 [Nitzschia inconspicua]
MYQCRAKKTQDETVATRRDDREGTTTDVTSTASSSSSSLVATPLATAPSFVRLVTTNKKRKDAPLSSTDTTRRTKDKTTNINKIDSCVVVGNTPSQSPNGNARKSPASSNKCSRTPNLLGHHNVRRQGHSIIEQGRCIVNQAPFESKLSEVVDKLKSLFDTYASLRSGNFRNFVENHLSPELKEKLLREYENCTANMGNRTMGPNQAATKKQVASNDDILEELLQTHAPRIGQSIGEKFWIKKSQNVVAHPANGTPSNNPSIVFPSGYLVFDSFCHGGLRERFNDRMRQGTCQNTTKAVRYAQFALKKFKVRKQGRDWYTVSCGGYNLVYIERKESEKPIPSNTSSAIVVPVELHSKQRVKISHWTRARECVVCLAKAKEQYPHLNRDEMRKQKLINQSGAGCPDCKKGEGAAVCKHCWNQFDHQL